MWEQIRANRRRSVVLIIAMALLLGAMGWALGMLALGPDFAGFGIVFGLGILFIQLIIYRFSAKELLLQGSGAKELVRDDSPRLFNIVEEMMLASGLQVMPRIFLIEDSAPNAFAMGRSPEDSALGVTSGLLYRLNRDELQGVIAHEVAHINNRDIQFMTLAGVILGSMIILSDWVWDSFRFGTRSRYRSSDDRDSGAGHLVLYLVAIVIVILAPIFAQLLYYASSRQREFLADACGAQYTRYPAGLASALEKIAGSGIAMSTSNRAMAAMCIINPSYAALASEPTSMFSTHPPTVERVRILRTMAGAGLGAYDSAYAALMGKGVVGRESLAEATSIPLREGSGEGPIETRHDSRGVALRRSGYVDCTCAGCGATMSVAPTYTENSIRCVRCGTETTLPEAVEVPGGGAHDVMAAAMPGAGGMVSGADLPPLQYVRQMTGWESFRCSCGGSIQLSPKFSGSLVSCPKCKRRVEVSQTAV